MNEMKTFHGTCGKTQLQYTIDPTCDVVHVIATMKGWQDFEMHDELMYYYDILVDLLLEENSEEFEDEDEEFEFVEKIKGYVQSLTMDLTINISKIKY